ncbi:MAG: activator of HSP90 ATPase 1 family protein [Saprospiraceae bacterium]|jgi:uncharacterized protein YndB with AHSA1/START domain|nr:activator of HSP90 ATPase 1 family protein [Saprospiraceae bacterium]
MARTKITCEFLLRASPTIVYQFLSDTTCLIRWFCDHVEIEDEVYSFYWNGQAEQAELIDDVEDDRLRFVWSDSDVASEYLEFKITTSPVTDETILTITDFCDVDEVADQKMFWEAQIKKMTHVMGA